MAFKKKASGMDMLKNAALQMGNPQMSKKRKATKKASDHDADDKTARKPKPKGKGIVKALGQKKTMGNFAKIAKTKGKGAAISALQNKLAKRRGQAVPFKRAKKGKSKNGAAMAKKLAC